MNKNITVLPSIVEEVGQYSLRAAEIILAGESLKRLMRGLRSAKGRVKSARVDLQKFMTEAEIDTMVTTTILQEGD